MKVCILYDDVHGRANAQPDELGVIETVDAVEAALGELGHAPARLGLGQPANDWLRDIVASDAELFFNLCDGVGGLSAFELHAAAVVELLGVPVTGSSAETLALARRKDRVNVLLERAGVSVPRWTTAHRANEWRIFPAIVKPAAEDASIGITQASVCTDARELKEAIERSARLGPLLIQEFLGGAELNVGIVGSSIMPVAEIVYDPRNGMWPLVTYAAKWDSGSSEYVGTESRVPAQISCEVTAPAVQIAKAAWKTVEGRGYGRVDLRADANGRIYVLEVNPNPDLSPTAGLAKMVYAAGLSYVNLVERIIQAALTNEVVGV